MKSTVKRILSGLVAMSMVMGSAVSVSAAGTAADLEATAGNTVTIAGSGVELPFIDVTVSTTDAASLQINPFNLGNRGQIYTGDVEVINNSEVPIAVTIAGVKVTANNIEILTKAPSATSTTKQALVNLIYTDGTGKATTKALSDSTDGTDIAVATAMTPLGGKISYTIGGAVTVAPTGGWNSANDKITVSNVFKFVPQTFASYKITKTLALYAGDSDTVVATKNETELPSSILGDSKVEIPVIWVGTTDTNKGQPYNSASPVADKYVAKIDDTALTEDQTNAGRSLRNADIYDVGTLEMPTITVTVASTEP